MLPRRISLVIVTVALAACAAGQPKVSDTRAARDCRLQAEAYMGAHLAQIAKEWREHERNRQFRICMARRGE